MAELEKYAEYPRSNFPVSVDDWANMQDLNAVTGPVANQYSQYISNNDYVNASQFLQNHPEIQSALFNADKINKLTDGIKATQKFFKEKVETYMDQIADETERLFQNTIGINDNAVGEDKKTNTYSAEKIDRLHNTFTATLPFSQWVQDGDYYTQSIEYEGLTENDSPTISIINTDFDVKKKAQKYMSMCNANSVNGGVVFICKKLPDVDIELLFKGV